MPGGVPNTNHNSYSRHTISISLATTYDCIIKWRPSVRATNHTLIPVPFTRPQPRIVTCLPSILSHNSRNVIPSYNSRNDSASLILKVIPISRVKASISFNLTYTDQYTLNLGLRDSNASTNLPARAPTLWTSRSKSNMRDL